jgi:hypothetical protein
MGKIVGIAALIFVGILIYQLGARLSSDAVGMAVGLVFGVLAGIPSALLVLATGERGKRDDDAGDTIDWQRRYYSAEWHAGYLAGQRDVNNMARGSLPDAGHESLAERERRFSVSRPFDIVPVQPVSAHAPEFDEDGCPDWMEPFIWKELYCEGAKSPRWEVVDEERRFSIVPIPEVRR